MANSPFIGEIRAVGFNFAPKNWAMCNGQLLAISQNQALFSILGTRYGGNGQTTFALPNLRGRTPIHMGAGHTLGEAAGSSSVTINIQQLPTHTHIMNATTSPTGAQNDPTNAFLGSVNSLYGPAASLTTLHPSSVTSIGGSQPHENRQPYLTISFCIALQGIFPSQ